MSKEINDFAHTMTNLISTFNDLSAESSGIIHALESLKTQSHAVKNVYAKMLSMTDKLRDSMHELAAIAETKETTQ
jgi:hypothetical protein